MARRWPQLWPKHFVTAGWGLGQGPSPGLGQKLGLIRHVAGLPLAICAHVTNNALVLCAQYLAESPDPPLLLPDAPGMTLAIAAAFSIAACATLRHHIRKPDAPPEP